MHEWVKGAIDAYLNIKTFKTKRKLVVIESDDWGSLRTKNKDFRRKINAINSKISDDIYVQYDSIATKEDLLALFEVLNSVRDINGNPACLTANVCTANPDFEKIKASNFEKFYYKPFTKTLEEYSEDTKLFDIWKTGIESKVFIPQLHGREHVHALAWLSELRAGHQDLLKAFELESWGIPYQAYLAQRRHNLQAALDVYNLEGEQSFQDKWIMDSTQIFEKHFGFKAKSFVPPAYTWHSNINKTLNQCHIKSLQGIKLQYQPKSHKLGYTKKLHYIGENDKKNTLIYTTRNAFFEPDTAPDKDWIDIVLRGVELAFEKNQPAIIGSHRLNFIGRLDENHRDKNLILFQRFLKQLVKKHPDIEFIDSADLAEILS